MRGQTLANALLMVKGELAYNTTSGVATAQDQELYALIDMKQQWLANEHDWSFLQVDKDVTVTAASRYATLPTTLDYGRLFVTTVFWSDYWLPVEFGVGIEQYNTFSSGDQKVAVKSDPILRWRYKDDGLQFEVWPVPITTQVFRFSGVRTLNTLKTAGSYDAAKTLDLDDLMVVYMVAAEKLARIKPEQAKLKLDLAQRRIWNMKSTSSVKSKITHLVPVNIEQQRKVVPLVVTVA